MSLQTATLTKEAITHITGLQACVKKINGEFEAKAIEPEKAVQLSKVHKAALYVVYAKANAYDGAITITTALHSGVFDSRTQCVSVFEALKKHEWVIELDGCISLTSKGQEYIQTYMYSKRTQINATAVVDLGKSGEVAQ